jgi:hypothetical protein
MQPTSKLYFRDWVSLPSMLRPFNRASHKGAESHALCAAMRWAWWGHAGVYPRAQRLTTHWSRRPTASARASLGLLGAAHRGRWVAQG